MQTKIEKLKNSKVKITVSVPATELVKHFNAAFNELAPSVKLAGFRPGKAPRKLIEESLGISRILSHALDNALRENYVSALQAEKMIPVSQPNITISKYPNYGLTPDEIKDDFEFEAEIEVIPEVELGDYSKIKVEKGRPEKAKDEDADKVIEHFQKQRSTFTDIGRPAQKGDFAEISFEGFQKGVKVDAMSSSHHPVVLGENTLIPGFEDKIIGMKKGDEKKFPIAFSKDYHAKEFADKEAEFQIKLNELKEIKLPDLNDEFAAGFGHKDMADLRRAVKENLEKELGEKYKNELESKVVEKILPLLKAEIPEGLINQEVERMVHEYEHQFKDRGINFETYLKSAKKTLEDLKKEIRNQAEKNVKIGLLLGKIIEDRKIDHHDPEAGRKALDYLVGELAK